MEKWNVADICFFVVLTKEGRKGEWQGKASAVPPPRRKKGRSGLERQQKDSGTNACLLLSCMYTPRHIKQINKNKTKTKHTAFPKLK